MKYSLLTRIFLIMTLLFITQLSATLLVDNFDHTLGSTPISIGLLAVNSVSTQSDIWDSPSLTDQNLPNDANYHANINFGYNIENVQKTYNSEIRTWVENWEGTDWIDNWTIEGGSWEVGIPTSGPNSAHSGLNCAATVLDGNYSEWMDSRLISQTFVVDETTVYLRFWQFYDYNAADWGVVQIRPIGGNWTDISPGYGGHSTGRWYRPKLDLTPYIGETVQICFYFHSADAHSWDDTSWGWYIDDLQFESGTIPFNPNEGFETGFGGWYTDFGCWDIGAPTSGPGAAHTGTGVAATVLDGNYYEWTDSRLISPLFVIDASTPCLRLWQMYDFNSSDNGTVQIRTVGGEWTNVSPTYGGHCSGRWFRPKYDLSAYIGQTVQLCFYFHSADAHSWDDTSWGWYIDDLQFESGTIPFNPNEGFETGFGGWYTDFGCWDIGAPTSGPGAAHTGTGVAATVLDGNYYEWTDSRLISPLFTITNPNQSNLQLRQWYSFNSADWGVIQLRTNEGDWTDISPGYSGAITQWQQVEIDLSEFVNQQIQLCFYFHSADSHSWDDTSYGWYIDDIFIGDNNTNPIVITPIIDITITEDSQASFNIFDTFYDPDVTTYGQILVYGCYGNNHIDVSINQTTGLVVLTPQPYWNGSEILMFYCFDQAGGSVFDEVLVTVTPIDNPVTINFPESFTINQNEYTTLDFASYISNPDGDILEIIISGNTNILIPDPINGTLVTFHPITNWVGSELLTISVNDATIARKSSGNSNNQHNRTIVIDQFTMHVINPLVVDFSTNSIMNNNVVANDPQTSLLFSATSNIPITSYQWDFDNDDIVDSESAELDYIYSSPGVKTVKLTASDDVHVTVVTKTDYVNVLPGTLVPPQVFDTDVIWTEAGGPYNISGELVFNNGISLTVEPNAQVNLMVDSLLIINGTINALDADFNAYGPNGWGGLVLNSSSNNSVINGINLYGAATGLTINGCNPVITNLELNGNSATRTVTTGITIHDNAAPTISNITINNFNQGLIAQNSTAIPEVLNISGISINRLSNNYAPNDIGISIEGDYDATLQDIMVVDYPSGVEIINPTGTSRPARLTNSRVVKTESSSRNPGTAIRIVNASYVAVVNDSLVGYAKGIDIENTYDTPIELQIASNWIDYNNLTISPDYAIQVSGNATGYIDSLWIAGYTTGISLSGNQALQMEYNTILNCAYALQDWQNQSNHLFRRNTVYRNIQYNGSTEIPALLLAHTTNLTAINNTFYNCKRYLSALSASSLTYKQNIAWNSPPIDNPIILSDISVINATYNDIAIPDGSYPGVGNINSNPMFINAEEGNFALSPGSPCINSGDPAYPHDIDTSVVDMGSIMWDVTTIPLVADFSYTNTTGQNPLTVHFSEQSSSIAIGWSWDFNYDDIIDSNEENPIWTYTTPGNYTVKLTVWDGIRFESKVCLNLITVLNSGPIITQPLPDITRAEDFTTFQINLSSYFSDANGDPLTYSYNVDSNIVTALVDQNILTISSALNQYGTVNFTVTAEDGFPSPGKQSNTYTRTAKSGDNRISPRVSVSDSFTLTISAINDPPVIEAYSPNADSLEVEYNVPIAFSVTATDVDSPLQYYWYLNDVLQTDNDNTMTCQFSPAPSNRLKVKVSDGILDVFHTWIVTSSSANDDNLQVVSTALNRIYPNPFNHETKIEYQLKSPARVKIEVFNVKGQLVRTLINQDETSGVHNVKWSVNHNNKYDLPNGIYFLRVQLHDQSIVRRVVLIK